MDHIQPIVGQWYYIDRLDGTQREELLAIKGNKVVLRDTQGHVDTLDQQRIVCYAPRPFAMSDVMQAEYAGWPLALAVLVWSAWREIQSA